MVKINILVVEDNETILAIQTTVLKTLGYDVRGVTSGMAALTALVEDKPDLAVLDITLPDIDGFKICQYIKNNPALKDIPVIMVTARDTDEDRKRGKQAGADCYFTKPFRAAEVTKTIRQLLDKQ